MSFMEIGKNAIAAQVGKEAVKALQKVNPSELVAGLAKGATELNESLGEDNDHNGQVDREQIRKHIEAGSAEFGKAFHLLELASAAADKKKANK